MTPSDGSVDEKPGVDVSVVVINHNYGQFLRAAIDSVLSQTVRPRQVVVVDDGSTDDSCDIIKQYADSITTVLKPAGGHVSAVNAGYERATGALVIFLDADDILYPDCLDVVSKAWQSTDVKVQYRLDTIDIDGVDQNMPFPYFASDLGPDEVRRQAFRHGVYPWTVSTGNAYAKDFLARLLPIDATVIYRSPDGYLNKMAPLYGDVRSLQAVLGAYRVHGANAWAQDNNVFRIDPVIRWLKFDLVLQAEFEGIAQARNIVLPKANPVRSPQQLEYRILACRLAHGHSPYTQDTTLRLFLSGLRTVAVAPNVSLSGRIVWFAWVFVLTFFPKAMVQRFFGTARSQKGRTRLSRLLVYLSRRI